MTPGQQLYSLAQELCKADGAARTADRLMAIAATMLLAAGTRPADLSGRLIRSLDYLDENNTDARH